MVEVIGSIGLSLLDIPTWHTTRVSNDFTQKRIITSHVCGRGNVFVVSLCVFLSVYVCVCLSVQAITFEAVDIETSFLV